MTKKRQIFVTRKREEPEEANPSSISFAYTDTNVTCLKKRTPFECVICLGDYKINVPHGTDKCKHKICRTCARDYFNMVLHDTRYHSFETVHCPSLGCKELFITDKVILNFFSKAEIKRWWNIAIINAYMNNKIKCPMPDCIGLFDVQDSFTRQCTFVECYECHRGFCVACQSPWHPGEIKLFDDEHEINQTLKKAEQNQWSRCPVCARIVEKRSGCSTMKCFCGTMFCYRCGGISDDHSCRNHCQDLDSKELNAIRSSMFVNQKKPRV